MLEEDFLKVSVGSRILNTAFLSTSKDKTTVDLLSGQSQEKDIALCTYIVKNENYRRTALDIGHLSCFPDEREVLILPFTVFRVENITVPPDRSQPIEIKLIEEDFNIFMSTDQKFVSVRI
jgi:hypothetical protein